jgi:uncharacterized membrane protein
MYLRDGWLRDHAIVIAVSLVVLVFSLLFLGVVTIWIGVDTIWMLIYPGLIGLFLFICSLIGSDADRGAIGVSNRSTQQSSTHEADETPLDALRRRYAEGELTDDQFERKLEHLLETETLKATEDRLKARDLLHEPDR